MATVLLRNGPCDPRTVEMIVTPDADALTIRPVPFACQDVYAVVDRFTEHDEVTHATGEYLYTLGARQDRDRYRRALGRIGAGRAFLVKTEQQASRVH